MTSTRRFHSRRKVLGLVGGGLVIAAAPPTYFLNTRTPTKALESWSRAGQYPDARLRALSYALLAPNPHNRQPWVAELRVPDQVALYRDPERDLPITDPFGRQLTIGMGCFIELMEMAASSERVGTTTQLFPDGEGVEHPVAITTFKPDSAEPELLFAHVMERRSHKDLFEARDVTAEAVQSLLSYSEIVLGGEPRDALKRIAKDAWLAEANSPAAWQESVDLLRIGKGEINASPDGIDVGGPVLDTLALFGLFNRTAASDMNNPGTKGAIEDTANCILSAPAFTLNKTLGNTRRDQIAAGRAWLRLNLAATGAGLALRPVSQALQEYTAVKPYYNEIHQQFAKPGETIQMLGLLGYGARSARTPRWPLETRIRNA